MKNKKSKYKQNNYHVYVHFIHSAMTLNKVSLHLH